jgi:hypothetical protein
MVAPLRQQQPNVSSGQLVSSISTGNSAQQQQLVNVVSFQLAQPAVSGQQLYQPPPGSSSFVTAVSTHPSSGLVLPAQQQQLMVEKVVVPWGWKRLLFNGAIVYFRSVYFLLHAEILVTTKL